MQFLNKLASLKTHTVDLIRGILGFFAILIGILSLLLMVALPFGLATSLQIPSIVTISLMALCFFVPLALFRIAEPIDNLLLKIR